MSIYAEYEAALRYAADQPQIIPPWTKLHPLMVTHLYRHFQAANGVKGPRRSGTITCENRRRS